MHWLIGYGFGLATAALLKTRGRNFGDVARPIAVKAITEGMRVGRELGRVTEEARAGLEDIAAEARDQVEGDNTTPVDGAR